jgi:hypothetical protein
MNHDFFLLHAIALAKRAPLGQSVARSAIGAKTQRVVAYFSKKFQFILPFCNAENLSVVQIHEKCCNYALLKTFARDVTMERLYIPSMSMSIF